MKILVTGGAGFIGSHLVDRLISFKHQVVVLDDLSTGKKEQVNPKAQFFKGDIKKVKDLEGLSGKIEAVFHLAARMRVQESFLKPVEYHKNNVDGTLNLLEWARARKIKRFIFASSCSVYGNAKKTSAGVSESTPTNPLSPYASEKLIGEELCRMYSNSLGLDTVVCRFFNVYGERMSAEGGYVGAITKFLNQVKVDESLSIWGDGEQVRDFIHVSDLTAALLRLVGAKFKDQAITHLFNLGSGQATSVNRLADLIAGPKYHRKHLPAVQEPRWIKANLGAVTRAIKWAPRVRLEQGLEGLM
ncbi:MAG: NAD-dependent epimerase/dehydratase family protein [bacterium]